MGVKKRTKRQRNELRDWLEAHKADHRFDAANPQQVPDLELFCNDLPIGRKTKFTLEGRPWLRALLQDTADTIVLTKGRQIGWSVLLSALMAYYVRKYPGCEIIYCTMAEAQFRYFNQGRLRPMLGVQSDIKPERGENRIKSLRVNNGSLILLMSGSNSFSQALGYSADVLLLDEAASLPLHAKGNILETLHASDIGRTYIGGTGGIEGSEWEQEWLASTQQEWLNGKWVANNPAGATSGYHIPQRLSPYWTQAADDEKRRRYGKFEYDTQVLGIFSRAAQIPITLEMVKSCMSGEVWDTPQPTAAAAVVVEYVAAIDLAAGGDSDTVIVIVQHTDDAAYRVCYAKRITADYVHEIMPQIEPVITVWQPTRIAIDSGGNKELRRALVNKYAQVRPYQFAGGNTNIKYGDDTDVVNRTAFVQRVVERFKERRISLPLPVAEPWVSEQLTAERMTTRTSVDRGTYVAYEKQDGRADDLLMALTFAEVDLFAQSDPANPHNIRTVSYAQYDPTQGITDDY